MSNNRLYRKRYTLLLLFSSLIHIGGFVVYALWLVPEQTVKQEQSSVVVQLKRADPPPEPKVLDEDRDATPEPSKPETPQEQHAPIDNSDQFASDNQDDRSVTELVAGGAPDKPPSVSQEQEQSDNSSEAGPAAEQMEAELALKEPPSESVDEISTKRTDPAIDTGEAEYLVSEGDSWAIKKEDDENQEGAISKETTSQVAGAGASSPSLEIDALQLDEIVPDLELPSEFHNRYGNMELLSDSALSDSFVKQPFSKKKSKEIEMANRYLERMNKQVRAVWVNPYRGGQMLRGIVRVELSLQGYLKDVWVYRRSGLSELDQSVIDAIKSVVRFQVPEDENIVARYYSQMSFHYSSIEAKTELMPFEQAQLAKNEDS